MNFFFHSYLEASSTSEFKTVPLLHILPWVCKSSSCSKDTVSLVLLYCFEMEWAGAGGGAWWVGGRTEERVVVMSTQRSQPQNSPLHCEVLRQNWNHSYLRNRDLLGNVQSSHLISRVGKLGPPVGETWILFQDKECSLLLVVLPICSSYFYFAHFSFHLTSL